MKICPTCKKTYTEEERYFCTEDGDLLDEVGETPGDEAGGGEAVEPSAEKPTTGGAGAGPPTKKPIRGPSADLNARLAELRVRRLGAVGEPAGKTEAAREAEERRRRPVTEEVEELEEIGEVEPGEQESPDQPEMPPPPPAVSDLLQPEPPLTEEAQPLPKASAAPEASAAPVLTPASYTPRSDTWDLLGRKLGRRWLVVGGVTAAVVAVAAVVLALAGGDDAPRADAHHRPDATPARARADAAASAALEPDSAVRPSPDAATMTAVEPDAAAPRAPRPADRPHPAAVTASRRKAHRPRRGRRRRGKRRRRRGRRVLQTTVDPFAR